MRTSNSYRWAKKPTEMKAALKIHNAVMRKLIREYRGYEVKTNGDSFMVCFSDCMDAVNWACQVQRELLESKWPGDILDAFDCRVEWNKDKHLLYRGLRIRIGLHFGEAERVHDTVTRRMDYFGNTVNTAARVESEAKGGQVFISEALFMRVKQFLEDFSKYAPKPEEVVQTMVSVPVVAGLDAPVVQLEAPPPIEIAPASPTVEKDPVRRFSESLSPIDEGAALIEQPLPIAKGLEKYREGVVPQRKPSPLLPKLDLDDADEDTILYKFAGSYQLKGIQGKTNLYEVVPYPLRERKYDDTKKEEEEEKAALSARSGKSSGRSKGSGRASSPLRMLSPAMASFNKRNKVQPK
jgi:class 3 adenylate cyclase